MVQLEASPEESKNDTQANAKLLDFLRRYAPSAERKPDILQDRYQIDLATPLPEFDSQTSQAFAASDSQEPSRMLFATICKPGTVQRHRVIQALRQVNHQYI